MAKRKYKKFEMEEGYYRLDELPKGEFIKRKAAAHRVYIKGEYDRGSKRYYVTDAEDINNYMLVAGSTKVFAGFSY